MNRSRLLLVFVALPLALGACKKKAPVVAPPQSTGPATPPPAATPPRPTETSTAPAVDPNEAIRRATEAARARLLETIYFEYNMDELREDARATLDQKLSLLNANPAVRIRISGHCDERGNDEYNLVLGRRRAEAAKRYLTDRGVDASRIETASFGRERPAVQGSTEEAYAKNRRDEFEITAGGDQLRAGT
jgi:peptidoglycan-associated lipoprotein